MLLYLLIITFWPLSLKGHLGMFTYYPSMTDRAYKWSSTLMEDILISSSGAQKRKRSQFIIKTEMWPRLSRSLELTAQRLLNY